MAQTHAIAAPTLHPRSLCVAFCAAGVLLTACVSGPNPGLKAAAPPTTPATRTSPSGVVAESLLTIERQSEDIMDIVPAASWTNVDADVSAIEKAWTIYQVGASNDGATQAMQDRITEAFARLRAASQSKDAIATLQSANDVSAVVVEMFDLYHPAVPTDIGRLDVLERQVVFDVASKKLTAAADTLAKVNTVWQRVKSSVLEHDGETAAGQFDRSLILQAEALKADASKALAEEAQNGLESSRCARGALLTRWSSRACRTLTSSCRCHRGTLRYLRFCGGGRHGQAAVTCGQT